MAMVYEGEVGRVKCNITLSERAAGVDTMDVYDKRVTWCEMTKPQPWASLLWNLHTHASITVMDMNIGL
jgi:hypothetical protein